jgi:hypothetical protein
MPRVQRGLVVLAATVAAVCASAFGASYASARSASPHAAGAAQVQTITLRGRKGIDGPWLRRLSLKLRREDRPVTFSLCALLGSKTITPDCTAKPGVKLPAGSRMRLEQRRGSKGSWKLVGVSLEPALDARLSNGVAGNRFGAVHYRVRLRGPNGVTLLTSNPFTVFWHR